MIKVKVNAKVNISLLINGIEKGFHMLDSVVASASIADVISLSKSEKDNVTMSIPLPIIEEKIYNLVSYMRSLFTFPCVDIKIDKNIPLGGGLGGSSAGFAGVIRGIDALFNLNLTKEKMIDIANQTGSDTAFMLYGGCGKIINRCEVIGEFEMEKRRAVIATKGFCDTKQVFAIYDNSPATLQYIDNDALITALKNGSDIAGLNVNVLTPCASCIESEIQKGLDILGEGASMSGSGSSIFAFDVENEKIELLQNAGFKVFPCYIGSYKTEVIKE